MTAPRARGFAFKIVATESSGHARAAVLSTPHGDVETPTFMPVGTQGSVKGLTADEVAATGARIMLGNLYAEGRGTQSDLTSAYAWLYAAALQGDNRGRATLESLERQLAVFELAEAKARACALLPNSRRASEIAVLH